MLIPEPQVTDVTITDEWNKPVTFAVAGEGITKTVREWHALERENAALRRSLEEALRALGHNGPSHAYYNLDGAVIDAKMSGWDSICMRTASRVRDQIGAAMKILADATKAESQTVSGSSSGDVHET